MTTNSDINFFLKCIKLKATKTFVRKNLWIFSPDRRENPFSSCLGEKKKIGMRAGRVFEQIPNLVAPKKGRTTLLFYFD